MQFDGDGNLNFLGFLVCSRSIKRNSILLLMQEE
jgi:hypothetical protein